MDTKIEKELKQILENYELGSDIVSIDPVNTGIINSTFLIKTKNGDYFIIQKINTGVFSEPYILMKNIEHVTNHIERFYRNNNDSRQCLKVIKTKDDESLCIIDDELDDRHYYRVYNYIKNAVTYNSVNDLNVVRNAGIGFGNFAKALDDYPIDDLDETIPNFHNTPNRYKALLKDIKIDPKNRSERVSKEILYFLKHEDDYGIITKGLESGIIKRRVTHNDTKINNVMMDEHSGEYVCVVDLDTVMPGSILYDYGDGIRSAASTAKDDERDLSQVGFNKDVFLSFTDGFLSETATILNESEINHMGISIQLITTELAMRFLNDYINGDTYFKTRYPDHNLVRARNQLKLANELENNMDDINYNIIKLAKKYK